jgi:predicted esterase
MRVERTIAVSIHGRYLVHVPDSAGPFPILAAFHGYAEDASTALERARQIPGSHRWLVVAIQGLHRFYRRLTREVIASWMTRQDRDLMIADNIEYVTKVVAAVRGEWDVSGLTVFSGFSQGVATAFRAACHSELPVRSVIGLGGDVPPELGSQALARIPTALIGRGDADELYTAEKCASDTSRLTEAGVRLTMCRLAAGHEWTPEFSRMAGDFLAQLE